MGTATAQRWTIDLAMLAAIGLLMGFLGPFDSDSAPIAERYVYWMTCIVGGGLIGIGADELLSRRITRRWRRVAAVSILMTPPVTLLVLVTQHLLVDQPVTWPAYQWLLWQVGPIMLAVMSVRALVWRRARVVVETRTVIAVPLPEAEAAFRRRLSAKRRLARLIAIEAHDHYLRVHTEVGPELITLRFADALDELALAHGWRVHRSWWVAADAMAEVRWRRGAGEIRLVGGLTVPVSRTYARMPWTSKCTAVIRERVALTVRVLGNRALVLTERMALHVGDFADHMENKGITDYFDEVGAAAIDGALAGFVEMLSTPEVGTLTHAIIRREYGEFRPISIAQADEFRGGSPTFDRPGIRELMEVRRAAHARFDGEFRRLGANLPELLEKELRRLYPWGAARR